jgi:hypothetical protein
MGRMITIDIDNILALFRTYGSFGPMPSDLFDAIGDCSIADVRAYADTCGERDAVDVYQDIREMFVSYMAEERVHEMEQ